MAWYFHAEIPYPYSEVTHFSFSFLGQNISDFLSLSRCEHTLYQLLKIICKWQCRKESRWNQKGISKQMEFAFNYSNKHFSMDLIKWFNCRNWLWHLFVTWRIYRWNQQLESYVIICLCDSNHDGSANFFQMVWLSSTGLWWKD